MKKLLTRTPSSKRPSRKLTDLLSGVAILITVITLLGVTVSSYTFDGKTQNVSGYAIYKGNTDENNAGLMFNVYEGEENVMKILAILRKYTVKATFFIGGIWAEKNRDTVLEIALAGHEIGSHGYLHRDHSKMSIEQNKEEIAISASLLKNITGKQVTLFAPPSGAFNENTEAACRALGQKMILWSKDTIDWRDKEVSLLVKRATKNISKGDLVLMHPKDQTVSALPEIIEAYQAQGFSLVTVSEVIT
ncbi:MAG TPA: polysaccharide deacetylase [Clostridiales bacterium]|nr:polysaccharide deacetylase [Clostridiales bacterium]